jgi:hypothetical protein
MTELKLRINFDDQFGVVGCALACYARSRGFESRTVVTIKLAFSLTL